ncbi:hypothetical protein [Cellulosimicrobium cellulans]|nr:hypothetical protein [Cellulosimicrobium cellulans]
MLVDGAAVHRIEAGLDSLVAQYHFAPSHHSRLLQAAPVVEHEHCWTP